MTLKKGKKGNTLPDWMFEMLNHEIRQLWVMDGRFGVQAMKLNQLFAANSLLNYC